MTASALGVAGGLAVSRPMALGLGGKLVELAGQAAMLVVLPSVLGLTDFGRFALVLTLVTLGGTAASLGGPALTARLVAGAPPAERAGAVASLARRMALARGALVAGAAVAAAIAAAVAPDVVDPGIAVLVVLALAVDVAATLAAQLALAAGRPAPWSLRYAVQNVLLVVLAPVGYAVAGLAGAAAALSLAALGSLLFGLVVLAGAAPRAARRQASAPVPPQASRLAVQAGASGLLQQLSFRGGVVLVALLHAGAETGRTAIAIGVALAAIYAVGQLFAVALPEQALAAASDGRRAEEGCRRLARSALPLVALGTLVGAALAAATDVWDAGEALAVALAAVALAPLLSAASQAAMLTLRAGVRLRATAAGAAAYVVAAPALVAALGAVGASLGLLLAVCVTVLAYRRVLPQVVGGGSLLTAMGVAAAAVALGQL